MFRADFTMRSTFGKFTAFIKQLENALCVEFKMDKKNVPKIVNWRIKTPDIEEDDDDIGP